VNFFRKIYSFDYMGHKYGNRTLVGILACNVVLMLGLGALNVVWVPFMQRTFGVGPAGLGLVDGAQGLGMALGGVAVGYLALRFRKVTLVGLITIGNAVGRLVSGWLFDTIGRRKTQFVMSTVAIIAPLTVVLALVTHSLGIAVTGLVICYISFGFAPTGSTTFIGAFFGHKNFPTNLSILNLQLIITSFAAPLAGQLKIATGDFISTFVILTAMSVVGLVLNIFIKKP
jgi:OFA family oxalate/formate antiporter-like MFS transporter